MVNNSSQGRQKVHHNRHDIYLIDASTKNKARPDDIFDLKQEVFQKVSTLADYRENRNHKVPMLKDHWSRGFVVAKLHRTYYRMIHTADFDKIIYTEMLNRSTEQREQYSLLTIDADLLEFVNRITHKPVFLTPPFFYEDSGTIASAYQGEFYARFENDCFRHKTMVVRQNGQEFFFGIYHHPKSSNPPFSQAYEVGSWCVARWHKPFLSEGNADERLQQYGTTFRDTYEVFKGLVHFWYGFKF